MLPVFSSLGIAKDEPARSAPSGLTALLRPLLVAAALLLLSGCTPSELPLPPLHPVKRTVTVDGQPVTGGQIAFVPTDKEKQQPLSAGQIDASGNYEIFTGGKPGAPDGRFKVTISPSMVPAEGAKGMPTTSYNSIYSDGNKTPLQVDVPQGPFDFKLKK
jgi:hypothetical protein